GGCTTRAQRTEKISALPGKAPEGRESCDREQQSSPITGDLSELLLSVSPFSTFVRLARQRGDFLGPLRSGCASHLVARRFDRLGSDPRCRSHIRRPRSPF